MNTEDILRVYIVISAYLLGVLNNEASLKVTSLSKRMACDWMLYIFCSSYLKNFLEQVEVEVSK